MNKGSWSELINDLRRSATTNGEREKGISVSSPKQLVGGRE